eukprot:TRINITY_DN5371_c0_g1_i1.p1 TRINITY_DN5371_c0_g1~~TRINITY_DN5371_c0_g1_i1.p1  ORF type:complete len:654 (+),score=234.87 TRINITY_DN5371_c0_g1_i1:51-2012(+)
MAAARAAAVLTLAVCTGVAHGGGLVGAGGGAVGHSRLGMGRRGGYGHVRDWPYGIFIGGSSIFEMNGLYEKYVGNTRAHTHAYKVVYKNIDTDWFIANVDASLYRETAKAQNEWVILDDTGCDRFASDGMSVLPHAGEQWSHVNRPEFSRWHRVGDEVRVKTDEPGILERGTEGVIEQIVPDDPERPMNVRFGDREPLWTQGFRLELFPAPYLEDTMAGDEHKRARLEQLPWQVVGLMSAESFADLKEKKARHDASLRATLGAPPDAAVHTFIKNMRAASGDDYSSVPELKEAAEACENAAGKDGATARLDELLEMVREDAALKSVVLTARAECRRRGGAFETALADVEAAVALTDIHARAFEVRALCLMDVGMHDWAVYDLERAHKRQRGRPGLDELMLAAHARARRMGYGPVAHYYMEDEVKMTRPDRHYRWQPGHRAKIIALGTTERPFTIMLERTEELVTLSDYFFERAQDRIGGREGAAGPTGSAPEEIAASSVAAGKARAAATGKADPYNVMGLPTGCSDKDIRSRHRRLSREHHPDVGGDTDLYQAVSAAYHILGDPARKRALDTGSDLPRLHYDETPLADQLMAFYFPERDSWREFGDPFKGKRRAVSRLEDEEAAMKAAEQRRVEAEEVRAYEAAQAAESEEEL